MSTCLVLDIDFVDAVVGLELELAEAAARCAGPLMLTGSLGDLKAIIVT